MNQDIKTQLPPKVSATPVAFLPFAKAINAIIDYLSRFVGLTPKTPLKLTQGRSGNSIIEIDVAELSKLLAQDAKARAGGGGASDADLANRVASLESRLAGFGPRAVFVCITGTLTSITFFTK